MLNLEKQTLLYAGLALIILLLLYQIFLSESANEKPIPNAWKYNDNMDLTRFGEKDFKPRISFDSGISMWVAYIEHPEDSPGGSIAALQYSTDGETWEYGYTDTKMYLVHLVEKTDKSVHIKIKDHAGRNIGPFEYPFDFATAPK